MEIENEKKINSLQKMRRVNALTGVLSNKKFIELVNEFEEGPFLLDVFARSIEAELERMFQTDEKLKESLSGLCKSVDIAYAKVQAMSNSPIQAILNRLFDNIVGNSMDHSESVHQPAPASYSSDRRRGSADTSISGF
jgi:hypothetical protein